MMTQTPYELFREKAVLFPEKQAVIFISSTEVEQAYSYKKLLCGVEYLARVFVTQYRIQKGDRVCCLLPNSPALISVYLACQKIGAIPVLLNPALPTDRVLQTLEETDSKLCLANWDVLHKHEDNLDNMPVCIMDIFFPIRDLYEENPAETKQVQMYSEDTASILYSSGTTGPQKGVELTVNNIFHNTYHAGALTGMTSNDRPICFLPLTHCFGINFITISALRNGATLILHEKFDPQQVLKSVVRNEVTMFFAVPTIYQMFLKQEVDSSCFESVRYFFYAADSLPVESILAWKNAYGKTIATGWGLTETTPLVTINPLSRYVLGSVGIPISDVEIKIVNENRELITDCLKYGEICVRGPNVMKGYLNKPEETKEVMQDGWFYTGDIGYVDENNYLFIVDRKKDMINVGGEKAWPREIEGILAQHPMIKDVGVVGIPDDIIGEVPAAVIVLKCPVDKENLMELNDILIFAGLELLKHERPHGTNIVFVDVIPRNPSGKILRGKLKEFFVQT